MSAQKISRRQAIPILYTRGTHYEVGLDMGRTFGALIKSFLQLAGPLNEEYLPVYNTPKGKEVYNETLESVKKSFPQYIRELEGIADGAQVEFYKLFLLHMDDVTPFAVNATNKINKEPVGCSTICVNEDDCQILAHTEDALSETLNHFYFVNAHIINDTPQGKYNVKEERFLSLCYAGHLPGYTMNYNHHGLVFSINTLSANNLRTGKTPRHIITRALLSAENYDQAINILRDPGVGAADGCSINMTFLKQEGPLVFHNTEMGPAIEGIDESQLNIRAINRGENSLHCNKYLRLTTAEDINPVMTESSICRMNTFLSFKTPKTKDDVIKMLGDQSSTPHCVFRENNDVNEMVKTIAVGIFDCISKTVTIYSDNPITNEPQVVIPFVLKD